MQKKLVEMLHLELEPVGIYFGNMAAVSELGRLQKNEIV